MKVRLVQSFTDAQKWALLAACTAVVYTPEGEHFGIVPLEAMACSRPVIAVDSAGPKETVVNGRTGLLCEPDPHHFAQAMSTLAVGCPLTTHLPFCLTHHQCGALGAAAGRLVHCMPTGDCSWRAVMW